jgi:hypothetical protein
MHGTEAWLRKMPAKSSGKHTAKAQENTQQILRKALSKFSGKHSGKSQQSTQQKP